MRDTAWFFSNFGFVQTFCAMCVRASRARFLWLPFAGILLISAIKIPYVAWYMDFLYPINESHHNTTRMRDAVGSICIIEFNNIDEKSRTYL